MGKAKEKIDLGGAVFHLGMDFYQGLAGSRLFSRYHIIAYRHNSAVKQLKKEGVEIFTLADKLKPDELVPRSSGHLLAHPLVQEYIKKKSGQGRPIISFYKPSPKIEILVREKGWQIVGNSSRLNRRLEDKIGFFQLLKQNKSIFVPKTIIVHSQKIKSDPVANQLGLPVIIQSPRGWSGRTTYIANSGQELTKILKKLRGMVRISEYIPGPAITVNAVITREGKVIQSGPAYQLTGNPELTSLPMSTCGRGWPVQLNPATARQIKTSTKLVAGIISKQGFKGFFGLDFVLNPENKKASLIEINPRLTASFPFYTLLEIQAGLTPLLLRHYQSFINFKISSKQNDEEKRNRIEGTEIIQRNRQKKSLIIKKTLKSSGLDPSNQLTLIAPERGESIRFNQEVFKISTKRMVLVNKNNRITINRETKKNLKFFQKNIN